MQIKLTSPLRRCPVLIAVLFGIFIGPAFAQNNADRIQLSTDDGSVKISLKGPLVIDRMPDRTRIFSSSADHHIKILREPRIDAFKYINSVKPGKGGKKLDVKVSSKTLKVKAMLVDREARFTASFLIATEKVLTKIDASVANSNKGYLEEFINGVLFEGKNYLGEVPPSASPNTVLFFKQLISTDDVVRARAVPDGDETTAPVTFGNIEAQEMEAIQPFFTSGLSRQLMLIEGPKVLNRPVGLYMESGRIRARIEFRKDGRIGSIFLDRSKFTRKLADDVVSAIRKFKFIPAEINGTPVDVTRIVYYDFD